MELILDSTDNEVKVYVEALPDEVSYIANLRCLIMGKDSFFYVYILYTNKPLYMLIKRFLVLKLISLTFFIFLEY